MHTKFVNARLWIGGKSASVKIKSRLHRQAVRCLFTWCMTGSAVCHVLYFFLPTSPCLPSSIGWKAFDFFSVVSYQMAATKINAFVAASAADAAWMIIINWKTTRHRIADLPLNVVVGVFSTAKNSNSFSHASESYVKCRLRMETAGNFNRLLKVNASLFFKNAKIRWFGLLFGHMT